MAHAFQSTDRVTSLLSPGVRLVGGLRRAIDAALFLLAVGRKRIRGEVSVSPVSDEWLSAHEVDSSKHSRED